MGAPPIKSFFVLTVFLTLVGLLVPDFPAAPQITPSQMALQGQVMPSAGLNILGGRNGRGRATLLTGASISFGNVLYAQPDLIANGDAYYDKDLSLLLEATLDVQVLIGGADHADLKISQLPVSGNGFSTLLYSAGNRREDASFGVPNLPDAAMIKQVRAAEQPFPVRVIGVIKPTQSGLLSSTFQFSAEIAP